MEVPYMLDYYDGEKFHRVFLPAGQKRIRLSFKSDKLCPVIATPFGFSAPVLGSASVPGKSSVILTEREGQLCSALLNAAALNAESVSILSYKMLLDSLPPAFDEVLFISRVTTGSQALFREIAKFSVSVSALPSGLWYSAVSTVQNLIIEGETDSISLELHPGLYSFYNPEKRLEYVLEVSEDGKTMGRCK